MTAAVITAGLTWPDVIAGCPAGSAFVRRVWREPESVGEAAMTCLSFPDPHTDREIGFPKSIAGRTTLARKRWKVLDRVLGKARYLAQMEMAA